MGDQIQVAAKAAASRFSDDATPSSALELSDSPTMTCYTDTHSSRVDPSQTRMIPPTSR
jgi:hypothetical protein